MIDRVNAYLSGFTDWRGEVMRALRDAILALAPAPSEVWKWAEPVYESGGPVCWMKAHKAHVTLGFWRGAALAGLDPRMESSGTKMGHIKLRGVAEIDPEQIARLVGAGMALNAELGDPTKGD